MNVLDKAELAKNGFFIFFASLYFGNTRSKRQLIASAFPIIPEKPIHGWMDYFFIAIHIGIRNKSFFSKQVKIV